MSLNNDTARLHGNTPGLVVIYGDGLGRLYNLNAPSAVIGRSSNCDCIDQTNLLIKDGENYRANPVYRKLLEEWAAETPDLMDRSPDRGGSMSSS